MFIEKVKLEYLGKEVNYYTKGQKLPSFTHKGLFSNLLYGFGQPCPLLNSAKSLVSAEIA
ncbi:hypothetical protein LZD49_34855 [Dyadobacter sp. CY261]|uniref:hypothetical protein n=1 Tax=Dyadobacter sp. CY261 TaxID=2907203 RepID=UPI001F4388A4|nr:hypothetical protein [Dyadobacter sp. CY261]MCF0075704.1 hypothetical protein [Dyadobacter sp. CY261]